MGRGTNAKPITLRSLNIYVHIIKFYYFYLNEEAPEIQLIYICASAERFFSSSGHFRLAGEPQSGLVTSQQAAGVHKEQLGTINSTPNLNLRSQRIQPRPRRVSDGSISAKTVDFMKPYVVMCCDCLFVFMFTEKIPQGVVNIFSKFQIPRSYCLVRKVF